MFNRRGQSTVEYAVLIAVIIGALIAMQIYMKRGTMGKLRESTDQIGDQFEPYSESYDLHKTLIGVRTEETLANGGSKQSDASVTQGKKGSNSPVGAGLAVEKLYN